MKMRAKSDPLGAPNIHPINPGQRKEGRTRENMMAVKQKVRNNKVNVNVVRNDGATPPDDLRRPRRVGNNKHNNKNETTTIFLP